MKTRYFAMVAGLVYILIGVLGFVPALVTTPVGQPELVIDQNFGLLLGLFPVNVLHNAVHFLVGIWGVMAYRSFLAARWFAGLTAAVFAGLAVLGFFPVLGTLFGYIPIYGHDIWLHAIFAIAGAYFVSLPAPSPAEADYSLRR